MTSNGIYEAHEKLKRMQIYNLLPYHSVSPVSPSLPSVNIDHLIEDLFNLVEREQALHKDSFHRVLSLHLKDVLK